MNVAIIVGIIFIIFGGIVLGIELLKRKRCKTSTNGTVVNIYTTVSRDSNGHITSKKYPIFQYNASGKSYVKKSSFSSTFTKYHIGQEVEILYNEKNPNEYYVKGTFGSMFLGIAFIVCGIAVIIFMMIK